MNKNERPLDLDRIDELALARVGSNQTMSTTTRTIDGRSAFLDYVFGYDDTERIVVHFEWPLDDLYWTVKIIEDDKTLAEATIYDVPQDWEPDISNAERLLLRYWRGEFPNTNTK